MRKIKNILNKLFFLIMCILLVFVLLLTNINKKVLAYTMNENLDLFELNVDNSSYIYENFEDDNVIVVLDTKVSKINKIHNVKYFSGIEIESTQTIKLSDFVDGKYKLLLYEQNSPYPWIQYFNCSVFVPCQETEILVTMDQYGF